MIISRTPLRISFFGGGTDYEQYFLHYGDGAVLGTTIDKYSYVALHDGRSEYFYDLPNKSGLGSSSAYTVGLLRACTNLDKQTIAKLATTWEFDKMGGNVGYQDQYLCSVGGFHLLRFTAQGTRDFLVQPELVAPLQDYLMLFNTHQYRRASDIVSHQIERMKKNQKVLSKMVKMVDEGYQILTGGDGYWREFGILLDEAWMLKKSLSKYVSTDSVDAIYDAAKKAGAIGGKILGGGGGGFIIFFVEPDKQEQVKVTLCDLKYVPFKFETEGTTVVYRDTVS